MNDKEAKDAAIFIFLVLIMVVGAAFLWSIMENSHPL